MPVKNPLKPTATATKPVTKLAGSLAKLGLRSEMDFVLHLPHRYIDETDIISIKQAQHYGGQVAQIEGKVTAAEVHYKPRRQLVVTIADETHQLVLRFINFYGSQLKQFEVGNLVRARGEIKHGFFGPEIVHPDYKIIHQGAPLPTQLTPVYPTGIGVSQATLRREIKNALSAANLHDTLSLKIRQQHDLIDFKAAIELLHNPPADCDLSELEDKSHPAFKRLKFDELLAQQLSLQRARMQRLSKAAPRLIGNTNNRQTTHYTASFLAALPFQLTTAQQRVLAEINHDIAAPHPMQRLLQGDVGSGKTIVAALAATQAIDSGYQAALMAPTEILADQHFRKIAAWLEPLGVGVAWLTGSLKKSEKIAARERIQSGAAQLVIGTHALIQDDVKFAQLGLVIIDEQHRFGVDQRLTLRNKGVDDNAGHHALIPHQLMMSATPIPRTLAMTYFADLHVSVIDELPPGRTPIMTRVIDQERRAEVIDRVGVAAAEGRQVYWVCPLIEESETLQLQTATDTHHMLQQALPNLHIGLVHGRMKPAEKQAVMSEFIAGTMHVLVATTVIEVGVDVPNASLMVIEHAERFGLSQLHQLRGRVGRGTAASVCLLLYQTPLGQIAKQRLMTMRASTDGFEIARKDLELRGPGDFLGARQAGLAMLRFADLEMDQWLVEQAQALASHLLSQTDAESAHIIEAHLARWMRHKEDYLRV